MNAANWWSGSSMTIGMSNGPMDLRYGATFWRPVADRLDPNRDKRFFSWPGLGNEPHDPSVRGLDDLVSMVLSDLGEPADLIAQSMGGLIAARVALAAPGKIRRLVLTATSAGVPVHAYGAIDWRTISGSFLRRRIGSLK
jgi:pimeloyl-ACP methyl ester carboxylesterase